MNEHNKSLNNLTQILEACGANPQGWPENRRAAMLALVRENASARALMDEAAALEAVLDAAPGVDDLAALHASILASALKQSDQAGGAQIVAFPQPIARNDNSAGRWGAAALLAASLLVGIWVGAGGYAESIVRAPLQAAGLDMDDQISSYYVGGISAVEELL